MTRSTKKGRSASTRASRDEPKENANSRRASLTRPMNPDEPFCFLITSFTDDRDFDEIRRRGIDPAVESFGFPAYRIDEIPTDAPIVEATRYHIALADFVVADLSGGRPNCYYEVGYAHAIGRPVVHIIRSNETPHFNVAGLSVVKYQDGRRLRELLHDHLLTHIFTTQGVADEEDTNRGAFGRRQFVDPYIVTGRVRVDEGDDNDPSLNFLVDLKVRSVDRRRPLRGLVTYHFHTSFEPRSSRIQAVDGVAEITGIETYGTFTVGVTLHSSGTKLELDLARLPGAGVEFRNR